MVLLPDGRFLGVHEEGFLLCCKSLSSGQQAGWLLPAAVMHNRTACSPCCPRKLDNRCSNMSDG